GSLVRTAPGVRHRGDLRRRLPGRGVAGPADSDISRCQTPLRSREGSVTPIARHDLAMARILLGVSGGIAAYKACEVCRLFVKGGHEVVPLVTPAAERFVTAETFRALARRPSAEDLYLHLTRADLLLVAPCTANTLAKLAHGLADNVLTEAALAHRGPVLVAPAMNPRMWSHQATRANAETLRTRGVTLVGPDEGETAEGELGVGRTAEPDETVPAAEKVLPGTSPLAGKRRKVGAGGTGGREPAADGLAALGERPGDGRVLVGFAADQGETGLERGREKRSRKRADLVVFNDVGRAGIGFDAPDNEVTLLSARGERTVARASKEEIAAAILDEVESLLG